MGWSGEIDRGWASLNSHVGIVVHGESSLSFVRLPILVLWLVSYLSNVYVWGSRRRRQNHPLWRTRIRNVRERELLCNNNMKMEWMVGRWYISQCLDALIYLSHTIADPLFIISLVWDIETVRSLLVPLVWIKRSLHSHSFRVLQSFSTVPWLLSSSEVCSRYYSKCAGRALTVHYTIPSSSSLPGLRIIAVDRSRQLDWPNNNNTLRSSRTPGTRFTTFSPNPGRRQASKQAVGAQYEINLGNKSVVPSKQIPLTHSGDDAKV